MSRSHEARKRLRTWVEGVACACAVTGRVLLDATTHLTWSVASELDDVKGIEDAGGVLKLIVDGVLSVPGRDPPSRSGYRSETVRRALLASSHARCQTFPGPGLTSGPWGDPPLEWSTMPVSSRGPAALVLVMPHMLINPQHPNPHKNGQGHQMRLAGTA